LGKKASSGDYSCIVTIARDTKSGYLFVVDINIKRRSVDDQIDAILNNHIKYNYKLFGVETNAAQYVIKENLRKKSIAEGIYIPLKEIENYQDKKMRVEGIIPLLMDGTIVFDKNKYDNNQQYNLGIEQLCTFTGENDRHDDFCDALEMTVRIAKANRFKMITLQNKRHPK
jgi:predicted phage terminase large subunit-like protein